jgi:hypothetical protein
MGKKIIVPFLATLVLASVHLAQAQQNKVYRVGVIHEGGPLGVHYLSADLTAKRLAILKEGGLKYEVQHFCRSQRRCCHG